MAQKKLTEGKAKREKQRSRRNKYHIKTDAKQRQKKLGVGWGGGGLAFPCLLTFICLSVLLQSTSFVKDQIRGKDLYGTIVLR